MLAALAIGTLEWCRVDPGGCPPEVPHRSGRARLRHPAPRIIGSLQDIYIDAQSWVLEVNTT